MTKFAVYRTATARVVVEASDAEDAEDIAMDEGEIYGDDQEVDVTWKVVPLEEDT